VGLLLRELGYGCQANRKTREGTNHPDRDAQFTHINTTVQTAIAAGEPAISVDTKKKELVGDFKNPGRELRPKGRPEPVRVHDFALSEQGKVAPYGVYDLAANQGWVSVGVDADTAAFAVESIRRWWYRLGQARYPEAKRLVITADCGGSNGARVRLWKRELQRFANETGLAVTVAHLPPGTSKWNRIEHRLFAYISQNWRGKPLVSHQVIVQLSHRPVDWCHDDPDGPDRPLRDRCQPLSQGHQGHCRRDGRPRHRTRPVPRRVELHHLTHPAAAMKQLFRVRSLAASHRQPCPIVPSPSRDRARQPHQRSDYSCEGAGRRSRSSYPL